MKQIVVDAADLKAALDIVSKAAPTKSSKRIFECARIRWPIAGGAEIAATDLDHCALVKLTTVGMTGTASVALPLDALASLGKATGPIAITAPEKKGGETVCVFDRGVRGVKRLIDGCDPDEYPELPLSIDDAIKSSSAPLLGSALEEAKPYVGREAARFVLNGVGLSPDGWLVGTDGRRLYRRRVLAKGLTGKGEHVVFALPKLTPKKVASIDRIALTSDGKTVILGAPGFVWAVRRMDGVFPDHNQIVPKGTTSWPLPPGFEEAVAVAAETQHAECESIAVEYRISERKTATMRVASSNGTARTEIDIPVAGEQQPLRIGFNGGFLRDVLKLGASWLETRPDKSNVGTGAALFPLGEGRDVVVMPIFME